MITAEELIKQIDRYKTQIMKKEIAIQVLKDLLKRSKPIPAGNEEYYQVIGAMPGKQATRFRERVLKVFQTRCNFILDTKAIMKQMNKEEPHIKHKSVGAYLSMLLDEGFINKISRGRYKYALPEMDIKEEDL